MIIHLLLTAWGYVAFMMFVLWFMQVKTKNASLLDIGWTAGLLICCWVYATGTGTLNPRKMLIFVLVGFWAVRLAGLLAVRLLRDRREDRRYARIREEWKTRQDLKFFFMFQFQGLLDVILSWGYLVICMNPSKNFSTFEYLALGVWIVGFVGEFIADGQLQAFKADPVNKARTCEYGLWYYSRHPNYFFEWLMWLAYFLMAVVAPFGWSVVISPVLMYYFLMHLSGVPLAEAQALRTKGDEYRRYQKTTSMFIPLPKRKI